METKRLKRLAQFVAPSNRCLNGNDNTRCTRHFNALSNESKFKSELTSKQMYVTHVTQRQKQSGEVFGLPRSSFTRKRPDHFHVVGALRFFC